MGWTKREEQIWNEINSWERQTFTNKGSDISRIYQKGIHSIFRHVEGAWTQRLLVTLDDMLFHLQAIIQQSSIDEQARERLLTQARVFHPDIYSIEDMQKLTIDQLRFIAKKTLAKQRLTALAQGSLTGVGGALFTASDLVLILTINLRTIQLMALTYGYDLNKPYEMMLTLKLFHAVSLPKQSQAIAWEQLFHEMESLDNDLFFYEGVDEVTSKAWLQRPIMHLLKLLLLSFARKKAIQGIPLFGIAAGASINYEFASHICESSHYFYQKRLLLNKVNDQM